MLYVKASYAVMVLVLGLMTWAYMVGATQSDDARYPPCPFNSLCRCSNAGPDFGLIFCEDIPMADIPEAINNTKVFGLHLRRNGLRRLEEHHFHGTGMWRVDIRHNLLTDIPENAFAGLERSLWELDLQYNKLQRIPQRAVQNLQKLKVLDLTGNEIVEVQAENFRGMDFLQTLSLAENGLQTIQDGVFRDLQRLEKLDLRGNNIKFLSPAVFNLGPSRLSVLNMADNLLTQIPFAALEPLKLLHTLNLARNNIPTTFDVFFTNQITMDTLILDLNAITQLPPFAFQNFGTVNRTSLVGNPITSIAEDAFKEAKIRELYLNDCYLAEIAPKAFRGLETSLHKLDLGYNNLTSLPENLFDNFDYLKFLSLRNNPLTFEPEQVFSGFRYTLQTLNLEGENMGEIPIHELNNMRNLRNLGFSSLRKDGKGDNVLNKEDFENFGPALETLSLARNGLHSIEDHAFQHTPGLKTLILTDNKIDRIGSDAFKDVGTSLHHLKLVNALSLTTLPSSPFQSLTSLHELDLSNNKIREIPPDVFFAMKDLRELNLQDNKLERLPSHLLVGDSHPALEEIRLSFNHLKSLDAQAFADFPALKRLFIDDNQIGRIEKGAFQNLHQLEVLNLEGSALQWIQQEAFQNLPKLEVLNLAYNELKGLDLDAFDQVGTLSTLKLDVSHNKIQQLLINGTTWSTYSSIKIIDFSHNNISLVARNYFDSIRSSLTHVHFRHNRLYNLTRDAFGEMQHLQLLDLSHNLLTYLAHDAFKNTKKLQILNLDYNELCDLAPEIFAEQPNLRVLRVSHNHLRSLAEGLFKNTTLEIFLASHNELTRFPETTLCHIATTLRHLDLSDNEIRSITGSQIERLVNLVYLDLSGNGITTLADGTFAPLHQLATLDLGLNHIEHLTPQVFDGLQDTLVQLSLANNSLDELPQLDLPNLLRLDVSDNELTSLPVTTLSNLTSLRELDLSFCQLPTVASPVWTATPRLKALKVAGNPIKVINNDSFVGLEKLAQLDLQDLPLTNFETGALVNLQALSFLKISGPAEVKNFNLAKVIQDNDALRKLVFKVDSANLEHELRGILPNKLSNITLTGPNLKSIANTAFQDVTSRLLRLSVHNTSVTEIYKTMFHNLGQVRWLELDLRHNKLSTVGEPSTTLYPGSLFTVFLTELRLSENGWNCDCGIGWVEFWMKKWRQHICHEDKSKAEYEDCRSTIADLREAECRNRGNSSLVETLKLDLECGWSSATHISSSSLIHLLALVLTFFVSRQLLSSQ